MRTSKLGGGFIDPAAAFTLGIDLQLNMIRSNLTQLYVPSARAEFRLWDFGWQDVPYFVRRRSEEQGARPSSTSNGSGASRRAARPRPARPPPPATARRRPPARRPAPSPLALRFPNTGFRNFVKFRSSVTPASCGRACRRSGTSKRRSSPRGSRWSASTATTTARSTRRRRDARGAREGGAAADGAARADLGGGSAADRLGGERHRRDSPFQGAAKRVETRYKVEHMSLAVVRVPLGGGATRRSPPTACAPSTGCSCARRRRTERSRTSAGSTSRPLRLTAIFQALEGALYMMRVGPRRPRHRDVGDDAGPRPQRARPDREAHAGGRARWTMCGEHHWNCEWKKASFGGDARLIAWSRKDELVGDGHAAAPARRGAGRRLLADGAARLPRRRRHRPLGDGRRRRWRRSRSTTSASSAAPSSPTPPS